MVWDRHLLGGRVRVWPVPSAAEGVLVDMEGRVDLKVVLLHSGMDGPSSYDTTGVGAEDVAARLSLLSVKPDLVVVGHSHRRMRDSVIAGVHFVQPDPFAQAVSVVHVSMVRAAGDRWYHLVQIRADLVPLAGVPPSPALERRQARAIQAVRTWAGVPLAVAQGDWSARFARAEDAPIVAFVNDVQRRAAGTQLSSTAAFDTRAGFGPGVVRLRDVAGMYPYENTLKAVKIDGDRLRDYLEQSAAYFRTYRPGEPIINEAVPGYNFDIVRGVSYSIDLTRPVGSRITQLGYHGRLVQATDTFTLALNDYRASGGGGFRMLAGLPVVYDRGESIRGLIVEAIRKADTLRATEYGEPSWRIVPEAAAAAVRASLARPTPLGRDTTLLRIFATNDLHGALEPQTPAWSGGRRVGGVAAIKGLMDVYAAGCRCPTLKLDGGDEMQGTTVSNWFYGRSVIEAMNAIGYDAAAVGNHEYDWGVDTLKRRIGESRYPWLTANTVGRTGGARPEWAQDWTMVEKAGHRIALIGLTTTTTPTQTKATNVEALSFTDQAAAVRRLLPAVRQAGAELVIVLAHAGGFCNPACQGEIFDVARSLDSASVDLIVSGHTHSELNAVVNGIPIVQARSHGTNLAVVDWARRADGKTEMRSQILVVWTDSIRADSGLARLVGRYRQDGARLANGPLTTLKLPLPKREGDFPLGHLLADAQRLAARADVGVMNNGGIRAELAAGPVTYGQVYDVQPFDNQIVKVAVSGSSLLKTLEHVVRGDRPAANVSGVEVWYDPSRPAGRRLKRARLMDGRSIQRGKTYTLGVTDFLALGGSKFAMLKGLPFNGTGVSDAEALANYLQRLPKPVEVPDVPRLHVER